mgnify:CR=1 FL=1
MAEGLSVALPLRIDEIDGAYGLNKDIITMAEQNLKMVVLTSPGERVMEPNFGVGVRRYLFEQNTPNLTGEIAARIRSQVKEYLPYINLKDVQVFSPSLHNDLMDKTTINIIIRYSIPAVNISNKILTIPLVA